MNILEGKQVSDTEYQRDRLTYGYVKPGSSPMDDAIILGMLQRTGQPYEWKGKTYVP